MKKVRDFLTMYIQKAIVAVLIHSMFLNPFLLVVKAAILP